YASALTRIGKAAVPGLAGVVRRGAEPARLSGIYALGAIGPSAKEAIPALVGVLRDKDESERMVAAEAILSIDSANRPAIEALTGYLKGPYKHGAAEILSLAGPQGIAAVKVLHETLVEGLAKKGAGDIDATTYVRAIDALGRIGPGAREALGTLEQVMDDCPSVEVAGAILQIDPSNRCARLLARSNFVVLICELTNHERP